MPLLEISNLVVHYGQINAIKGISLKVEEGQIVTIIGANGAGKSTLLKTISGIHRSTSGEILYKGKNITRAHPYEILEGGIAHVPEGRHIFKEFSVEENMRCGAYLNKSNNRVKELIEEQFEIFPELADRRRQIAGTLSGGEQQMLAIGRGLMSEPEILMLDEPSLGLAPILIERIFDLVIRINKTGRTILLVEQNANIALHVANFGYILETGKITMEDSAATLQENDSVKKAYLGIS